MFNTIRAKLLLSFFTVLLVTVGVSTATYFFNQDNNRLVEQAVNRDFNGSIQISELAILAQKIRRYEKEYFMYIGNAEKQAKYNREWEETFAKIDTKLKGLLKSYNNIWTGDERVAFLDWTRSLQAYGEGFRKVVSNVDRGILTDTLSANSAVQDAKNKFRVLVNGTIELANKKYQDAAEAGRQIKTQSAQLTQILFIALMASVVLSLLLIVAVPRSITRPIQQLSSRASAMSKGELETPVKTSKGVKDFNELTATLERMRISQKAMLKRLGVNTAGSIA